jgi:peptidoglycan/xylan/chitin deacetylase (PgdA/CDA1 family)
VRRVRGRLVRRRALEAPPLSPWHLAGVPGALLPRRWWDSLGSFCVDTSERVVSLTYDDGPHPEHTPRLLDVLGRHDVRATFFMLEGPALRHAEIVRRVLAEGHEIAVHGRDHRSLLTMSTDEAVAAIRTARSSLERIIGQPVRLYRPPYGQHTAAQARAVAAEGLELAIWSGDARDWVDAPEDEVVEYAWRSVHPGAVLLLHDDRADPERLAAHETLPAFDKALVLERLLRRLEQHSYRCLPMGAMLDRYPHVRTYARERMR